MKLYPEVPSLEISLALAECDFPPITAMEYWTDLEGKTPRLRIKPAINTSGTPAPTLSEALSIVPKYHQGRSLRIVYELMPLEPPGSWFAGYNFTGSKLLYGASVSPVEAVSRLIILMHDESMANGKLIRPWFETLGVMPHATAFEVETAYHHKRIVATPQELQQVRYAYQAFRTIIKSEQSHNGL